MRDDDFEWDDRKARKNFRDHAVSFDVAKRVFDDPSAFDRIDEGETDEERWLITGLVGDVLFTVCFVERGYRRRIISARKATYREKADYNEALSR